MAAVGVYIYIDNVKISDTKFSGADDFEITSTGLVIEGTQVWTYSGNLIFDGFAQLGFFPIGTIGALSDFTRTNGYIYLSTRAHAEYYKASYTDLSSVANAIRNKLGMSDQLEFPTGFVSVIEGISSGSADTAIIDIEVANGTATITSGEFPDWCNGSNKNLIWGTVFIDDGFVADGIANTEMEARVYDVGTYNGVAVIGSYSYTRELAFSFLTDLSMIGFASNEGLISMTSGRFEVVLIYCDPWSSGTTDEPIENNDPVV